MSLTSYRAAPPRVGSCVIAGGGVPADLYVCWVDWKTWRRPTLPRLKTQYHGRWGFSRPSSGGDGWEAPRYGHQVVQSPRLQVCTWGRLGCEGLAGVCVCALWRL